MNTVVQQAEIIINDGDTPWPCEVTVEQERINVSSERAVKPDAKWTHTDGNGHFHAFATNGELPTLNRETVPAPCDGSCGGVCNGEGYTVDRYTCLLCGEEVEPRYVPDMAARSPDASILGRKSAVVIVTSTVPIGSLNDRVTVRIRTGEPLDTAELFGVARIVAVEGSSDHIWVTTIAPRSLESRLSA